MKWNKYTLDRLEGDTAVFLKYPNETETLLLPSSLLNETVQKGDIVCITMENGVYTIDVLEKETDDQKDKIEQLLKKLKDKNN